MEACGAETACEALVEKDWFVVNAPAAIAADNEPSFCLFRLFRLFR
jgi:hypothetical protein